MKPERCYSLVTEDDEILESNLTREEAEDRLPGYIDEGVDAHIGEDR